VSSSAVDMAATAQRASDHLRGVERPAMTAAELGKQQQLADANQRRQAAETKRMRKALEAAEGVEPVQASYPLRLQPEAWSALSAHFQRFPMLAEERSMLRDKPEQTLEVPAPSHDDLIGPQRALRCRLPFTPALHLWHKHF
jgi:hypothetical protein